VKRLVALPSCEALAVVPGDGRPEVLVPLIADAVVRVDIDSREIELDLEFLGAELLASA
jgi:ribosomal 30S subunit maturation factor RimM